MRPNRANYRAAQERIAAGIWSVDPEAGLLYGRWRRPYTKRHTKGYIQAGWMEGKAKHYVLAHRVIWEHVHGELAVGLEVNHINGIPGDDRIANLEAVTSSQNRLHAYDHGLQPTNNLRLSHEHDADLLAASDAGLSQSALATRYGVSQSTIWRRLASLRRRPAGSCTAPSCGP